MLGHTRFLRFLFLGGVATLVNFSARVFLSLYMSYSPAVILAGIVGMVTAFFLYRHFVFQRSGRSIANEYLRFAVINILAIAQIWIFSLAFANWIFPAVGFAWHAKEIAHGIGLSVPIISSYFGYLHFSFSRQG